MSSDVANILASEPVHPGRRRSIGLHEASTS
jgi:hypothetical protein